METSSTETPSGVIINPLRPLMVRHVRVEADTHSITIRWEPPCDRSVPVDGYKVCWGGIVPDQNCARVDSSVLEHRVSRLASNTEYVVCVRAYNEAGEGFSVYEATRTLKDVTIGENIVKNDISSLSTNHHLIFNEEVKLFIDSNSACNSLISLASSFPHVPLVLQTPSASTDRPVPSRLRKQDAFEENPKNRWHRQTSEWNIELERVNSIDWEAVVEQAADENIHAAAETPASVKQPAKPAAAIAPRLSRPSPRKPSSVPMAELNRFPKCVLLVSGVLLLIFVTCLILLIVLFDQVKHAVEHLLSSL